ncbi:hypothetical protein JF544_03120 [Halobacillus kuroshimensis]|uniref:Uncharacterized protein n=1 Tax=Halobacillus kuroshimensis TaxID=302481 RepID=A0ABS3DSL6_9BACI|nr:hypothetical protein [Halobacillus kuroshimensis]MBN8234218.1 hypothetical protein [Halobacillus kuroshimensis]
MRILSIVSALLLICWGISFWMQKKQDGHEKKSRGLRWLEKVRLMEQLWEPVKEIKGVSVAPPLRIVAVHTRLTDAEAIRRLKTAWLMDWRYEGKGLVTESNSVLFYYEDGRPYWAFHELWGNSGTGNTVEGCRD